MYDESGAACDESGMVCEKLPYRRFFVSRCAPSTGPEAPKDLPIPFAIAFGALWGLQAWFCGSSCHPLKSGGGNGWNWVGGVACHLTTHSNAFLAFLVITVHKFVIFRAQLPPLQRLADGPFEPVAAKKPRGLSCALGDADLVNLDLLHVVPHCYAPQTIDDDIAATAWDSLRFSFENIFADEVAAASQEQQQMLYPLTPFEMQSNALAAAVAQPSTSESLDVKPEPMELEESTSTDVPLHSPRFMDIPGDGGLHKLEALLSSERRWGQCLDALYRSPSAGAADVGSVKSAIHSGMGKLDELLDTEVLQVPDLYKALELKSRAETALQACGVLESKGVYNDDVQEVEPQRLVSLVWVSQPLPRSFKNKNRARLTNKKKKGHCTLQAELLKAPGVSFVATTPVTASFYTHGEDRVASATAKRGKGRHKRPAEEIRGAELEQRSDIQIQNNVEHLEHDRVTFNFRFPAGTRNKPCSIRLHVRGMLTTTGADGQTRSQEVNVLSEPTHCFIVTTNECQYESAELKLMTMEMYPAGQSTCSWARFVNALSLRWMRVTRQESDSVIDAVVDRVLSLEDLQYFAQRFFCADPSNLQTPSRYVWALTFSSSRLAHVHCSLVVLATRSCASSIPSSAR